VGRGIWVFGAAALTAAALVGAQSAVVRADVGTTRTVDGRTDDWRGTSPRFAGAHQYVGGELVHQDHVYDDLGPDTKMRATQQHGSTGAPAGDYRYPADEDRYGYNAADLREVRFAEDGTGLWVLAQLNTLKQPDTTVVAVALDVDEDHATASSWPHAAGLRAAGADLVVTAWGSGGTITDLRSGATAPLADVAADLEDNAIELRVPLASLGGAAVVRSWAAAGLWDPTTETWLPAGSGTSPVVSARAFNVAFRAGEEGSYMEERQATVLATGDITPFVIDVDRAKLRTGATELFTPQPGTFNVVVLDQGITIPPHHEGVSYDGVPGRFGGAAGVLSQSFSFYGAHQPYGLYLPSTVGATSSIPAALVLHGHGGSHSSFNAQPGFLRDMGEGGGEHEPMILITPLARGSSFYADWGEADTLAALDDVLARYPVDLDRLYITGYSMGGYGTYRLASLYPDRFAAALTWAGYSGEFTGTYATAGVGDGRRGKTVIGNPVDTLENLLHVPLAHLTGTNDEILPVTGQYAAPRRLAELGYRSRLDVYPGYEHLTFALVDDWKQARAWLGDRTRTAAPRDVVYKFSDGWTAPGLAAELGLVHNGAWWLRGLTMRESTEDGLVLSSAAATSWGLAGRAVSVGETTTPATAPTPHVQREVTWTEGDDLPVQNRLDLDLRNVGTVSIDLAAAGLTPCGLELHVASDGPVVLTLSGRTVAGPFDGVVDLSDGC